MLCGAPPFDSPTATAVLLQHVESDPPPPRGLNPDIKPAVEAVVLRALSKKRERRPLTARMLANELTAAVELGFTPQETAALYVTNENEALPDDESDDDEIADSAATRLESLSDLVAGDEQAYPPPAPAPAPVAETRIVPPPQPPDWDPSRLSTGTLASGSALSAVRTGSHSDGLYVAESVSDAPHAAESTRGPAGLATFAQVHDPDPSRDRPRRRRARRVSRQGVPRLFVGEDGHRRADPARQSREPGGQQCVRPLQGEPGISSQRGRQGCHSGPGRARARRSAETRS